MKNKIGYLTMVLIAMSIIGVASVNAPDRFEERYAVGGEIIPVTSIPFIFSPTFVILIAIVAAILVAMGALLSGAVSIEIITER